MSGCADKCHFPHIPQNIESLQQDQPLDICIEPQAEKLMIGQCEIPKWSIKEASERQTAEGVYMSRGHESAEYPGAFSDAGVFEVEDFVEEPCQGLNSVIL